MNVRVDQSRQDKAVRGVDQPPGVNGAKLGGRTDRHDRAAVDRNRAMLHETGSVASHRQEMSTGDERVVHPGVLAANSVKLGERRSYR